MSIPRDIQSGGASLIWIIVEEEPLCSQQVRGGVMFSFFYYSGLGDMTVILLTGPLQLSSVISLSNDETHSMIE